jgi:hypothetical protein
MFPISRKTLRELYDENIRVLADFVGSDPKNLGIFINHTNVSIKRYSDTRPSLAQVDKKSGSLKHCLGMFH